MITRSLQCNANLHPYRVRVEARRLPDAKLVLAEDVFRADAFLESDLPLRALPVAFDRHYAAGTFENVPALERVEGMFPTPGRRSCAGVYWFHVFARHAGAAFDTRRLPDGPYRLDVIAWDEAGNHARKAVRIVVDNR